jgi:predicted metal-binding membrane protein
VTLRARPITVAASVIAVALACWIVIARSMRGMDMGPGSSLGSFPFFVGVWVTMMAAMMLPAALPMVLLYDRIRAGHRAAGRPQTPTAIFVASYLGVWAAVGVGAYLADRAIAQAGPGFLAWHRDGPIVAGLAIAGAWLY